MVIAEVHKIMFFENIAASLFYALSWTLVASIAGAIWSTVKQQGANAGTFFTSLITLNSPQYAPEGVRLYFSLILYSILGVMIYLGSLSLDPSMTGLLIDFSRANIFSVITILQSVALFIWARIAYTAANTPNQIQLKIFDISATLNFLWNQILNIGFIFKPSNWKQAYYPYLIPYISAMVSFVSFLWAFYCAFNNFESFLPLISFALLQVLYIRCMLQILSDQNLSAEGL